MTEPSRSLINFARFCVEANGMGWAHMIFNKIIAEEVGVVSCLFAFCLVFGVVLELLDCCAEDVRVCKSKVEEEKAWNCQG